TIFQKFEASKQLARMLKRSIDSNVSCKVPSGEQNRAEQIVGRLAEQLISRTLDRAALLPLDGGASRRLLRWAFTNTEEDRHTRIASRDQATARRPRYLVLICRM